MENCAEYFIVLMKRKSQAKKIVALGFYLGIGGTITYKNSKLPEVLKISAGKYCAGN